MKVEKDLRETDGVQDERRNGKTGGDVYKRQSHN